MALRQGALAAEPFPLPRASRSVWESGQTFFPPPPCPLGALRVPSIEGTSLGACGGLPWACRLQEGPVVPPPLTAEDLLPTPPLPGLQSSRPPSAPHSKVPPGPRHVPSAISISRSCPRSVCARQSTTAAACTPGSEGLFASRVLIYRGTV